MASPAKELIVRTLDFTVDWDNFEPDVKHLCILLNPSWKPENIVLKSLGGGRINKMFRCSLAGDDKYRDALVVRIYPSADRKLTEDKGNEIVGIHVNQLCGCGISIRANFNNGLAVEFSKGRQVSREDMDNEAIAKKVTQALARIHTFDPDSIRIRYDDGKAVNMVHHEVGMYTDKFMLRGVLGRIKDKLFCPEYQDRFDAEVPSIEELKKEVDWLMKWLKSSNLRYGIGHNDCNSNNMLYDEETGKLTIIDSDLYGNSYQQGEFALLLAVPGILRQTGNWKADAKDIDEATQKMWIRLYLTSRAEMDGKAASDVTDEMVDEYLHGVRQMAVVFNFAFGVNMLALNQQEVFNHIECGLDSLARYYKNKHLLT